MLNTEKSKALFKEALKHLAGGVNSPVRAFKSVGGSPIFIDRGDAAQIIDVDGNIYIDYVGSYGPLILGHNPPQITEALTEAIKKGTSFGATTEKEIELAVLIQEAFPSMQLLRFVNSGTEAVMSAIRLARGYTKKNKIIKFAGCYHGHSDYLLAQAGSGLATLSLPGSAGVPKNSVEDTLIASYNDIEHVSDLFTEFEGEIAAVIVEPVPGNMGVILPQNNFLRQLRELCYKNEALLITDEVMSGFRERFGGAQHAFDIEGDITCLGKIIGGGLPVGAYGGKKEIMEMVAPLGPVYQAGTLSGNPLAMTAGIEMLKILKEGTVYKHINQYTTQLSQEIINMGQKHSFPLSVNHFGSMFTPFLTDGNVNDYKTACNADTKKFGTFFWKLLENGVYPPPSQFEAWFVSNAMGEKELEKTVKAFDIVLQSVN